MLLCFGFLKYLRLYPVCIVYCSLMHMGESVMCEPTYAYVCRLYITSFYESRVAPKTCMYMLGTNLKPGLF